MCIDVNLILGYMTIGSYVLRVSIYYKEDTVTEEMLVIDVSAHVAVGLQWLEMSSITTLNQTNVCTRYIFKEFFFIRKNIGN